MTQRAAIERNTPGSADGFGQPVDNWGTISEAGGTPCRIEDAGGDEKLERKSVTETTHFCWLPAGTDITEDDRVTIDSVLYQVMYVARRPGGEGHHMRAELKEVRG